MKKRKRLKIKEFTYVKELIKLKKKKIIPNSERIIFIKIIYYFCYI